MFSSGFRERDLWPFKVGNRLTGGGELADLLTNLEVCICRVHISR